ncbi:MAG: hypothetical protein E6778_18410 [Niallia nealsonii]|uniref:Uncharacterized protein n=1 Tax=Niallia circulans TaxID=1397 RepID=A0A941JP68_NIACI|nr:hypothetical protein [Niallia circulans]MCB5238657.1 hypothetical protein [Niallia circulans]MDU1847505.1 hypothetical protein [Niallia nealsonii]
MNFKQQKIQKKYREMIEENISQKKRILEIILLILLILLLLRFFFPSVLNHNYIESYNEEVRWLVVTPEIENKLKITSIHYKDVTLAENSQLITYYIKTSFSTNNREKSNELINQTNKIIVSNKLPSLLQDDQKYEIIILGKENEILKHKIF